jgi:DNA polymerase I-like protein with 3'-5' exonuclease and polymerase domains
LELLGKRYVHALIVEGIKEVMAEVARVQPLLVLGLGNLPLWAFTGEWGITNWRGSEIVLPSGTHFVPTLHPNATNTNWAVRPYILHDLRQRVVKRMVKGFVSPNFTFNTSPDIEQVCNYLDSLKGDVSGDIETSQGRTICIGIADSATNAMCIPFKDGSGEYWGSDDHQIVVNALDALAHRPGVNWIGQNWNYDAQYMEEDFQLKIRPTFDTYIAQSVLFPGVERSLGFLGSMYCEWYSYWKDDGKDWKNIKDFNKEFRYNCRDVVATWEVAQVQKRLLQAAKLEKQFESRMKYGEHVYMMMRQGVNRDKVRTDTMIAEVEATIASNEALVAEAAGKVINFDSPKQVADLFYKQFACPLIKSRVTGNATTNDDALKRIVEKSPQHAPVAHAILESRSFRSLKSNFLEAECDPDGRFRSSWMATGAETFRLTSSGNAFHRGGPLQNITDGRHTSSGRTLPNLRSCIVPDEGHTIFNCDLERADLQVVVWEANDLDMMQKMIEHADVHTENAKDLFGLTVCTEQQRHMGKKFVHLCVDGQHEALTPNGWVNVSDVKDDECIVVCNADGSNAHMEKVNWHRQETQTDMVHLIGACYDQFVTYDHTIPYTTTSGKGWVVGKAQELPKSARLNKTCRFEGVEAINEKKAALLAAFHADGSISGKRVRFHFRKERKITRLIDKLERMDADYHVKSCLDGTTLIVIWGEEAKWLIDEGKAPKWGMLNWNADALDSYIAELPHWDGWIGKTSVSFSTANALTAEIIQTILHLRGRSGSILGSVLKGKTYYRVQVNNRPLSRIKSEHVPNWSGKVYCPITVPGFWLTRRNGRIAVTGNTNYGGQARTCSTGCGITVHQAELLQKRWFQAHPGILDWHRRTSASLLGTRTITNRFGYRRIYFDRVDGLLPEALAWLPQSTVSLLISMMQMAMDDALGTQIQMLMQGHDSVVGQYRTELEAEILPQLQAASHIAIPYETPLYIPLELATSTDSWGMVEKRAWPV